VEALTPTDKTLIGPHVAAHRGIRSGFSTLLLGLLTLLALALRVLRLDFQPLWWDEGYSVWFATHPLEQMAALTALDIHPPLYYALLHGWIGPLGAGPVALRLFSVAAGVLAIPAIYALGRRMLNTRAGLLAAFLLAINPFHVYYSQEVRMYGLMALLSTGVLWAAWQTMGRIGKSANRQIANSKSANDSLAVGRANEVTQAALSSGHPVTQSPGHPVTQSPSHPVTQSPSHPVTQSPCHLVTLSPCHLVTLSPGHPLTHSPTHLVTSPPALAYILLATAALYTQYYAVFIPIGLTLYACWHWRRDLAALARWLALQMIVALLYLPWVLYAAPKLVPYVSQKVVQDADRPLDLVTYVARHLSVFISGHLEGPLTPYWPFALVLLLPLAIGWWLSQRGNREWENEGMREWGNGGMGEWDSGRGGEGDESRSPTPPLARSPAPPRPHSPALLLAAATLTALALGWLISLRYPFFPLRGERLLLLALPPAILLAAAAVDALWTRARAAGVATLAIVGAFSAASLIAFYVVPRYPDDDYRPLIARTVEQGLPGETVFAVYPWQVGYWRSYGSSHGPIAALTPDAEWTPRVAEALDAALARGKVWFPAHLSLGAILETRVEQHLATAAIPFINTWYGPGTRLSGWAMMRPGVEVEAAAVAALAVRFPLRGSTGAVALAGVNAASGPIPAANTAVPLTLRWQASAPPPALAVSVRLVDAIGRIWAQHDYEPLGEMQNAECRTQNADCSPRQAVRASPGVGWQAEERLGLLIPAGTPPGQYAVEIAVHPKDDPRPLDVVAADGRSLGAAARLFELPVTPADRSLGPERLPIRVRREVDFADGLRLLGHTLDDRPAMPGEARPVNLFWQATAPPSGDYIAFVQLLDNAGQVASGWEAPPGGSWNTTAWPSGTLMRTQASLRPRADLPDGRYRLIAGLFRAADGARLRTTGGADHVVLGPVTVRGRSHDRTPPQPQHPAAASFGDAARLIGYDLAIGSAGAAAGERLPLTLYWQATNATDRPYTVFVHLMDADGHIRGYGDGEPGEGRFPTTGWLSGEYLTDPHNVSIDPAATPGSYRLRIGLYDPATGQRLLTPEGADHIDLASVSVR
jgi:hypothetical protein